MDVKLASIDRCEIERNLEEDRQLIERMRRRSPVNRERALEARAILNRAKRAAKKMRAY